MSLPVHTERSVNTKLVYEQLQNILTGMNLKAVQDFQSEIAEVAHAMLFHKDSGKIISEGSGKGTYFQVGAIAEAIEHLCLQSDMERPGLQVSFNKICQQQLLKADKIISEAYSEIYEGSCKTKIFKTIHGQFCYLPEAYLNPFLPIKKENIFESILQKYATNSGTSFGASFEDSCLHSLNEIIERHYLSLFYLKLMGFKRSEVWTNNIRKTEKQRFKVEFIESQFNGKVISIATKTEFEVYVAISLFISNEYILTPVTAGCSLSLEYASSRAIDEMAQYLCLYNTECEAADKSSEKNLMRGKMLQRLIHLDEKKINSHIESTPLHDRLIYGLSSAEQLHIIITELRKCSYNFLYRSLIKFKGGSEVVQVYIPGLERFNLIRSGSVVAPQMELEI